MQKIFVLIALMTMCGLKVTAQDNILGISWSIQKPLTNKQFEKNTSLAGIRLDYRHFLDENVSVGINVGTQSFDQYYERQTYYQDNGAVTTDLYRYLYTIPAVITSHYYFGASDRLRPFAGLGIGARYSRQNLYYNIYNDAYSNWGLMVRPEVGFLLSIGQNANKGLSFSVNYDYSTNKESTLNIKNIQNVGAQIGLWFTTGR